MDIGKLFRDGWGLFTKDVGPLIVGMLIACIIPAVAMTIVIAVTLGASLGGITTDAQGEVTSVDSSSVVVWIVGSVVIVVVADLPHGPALRRPSRRGAAARAPGPADGLRRRLQRFPHLRPRGRGRRPARDHLRGHAAGAHGA